MSPVRVTARELLAIGGLLLLGALFAALGAWQWQRAATSRAVLAQFEAEGAAAPAATLPRALDEASRFRRVEVRGEFVAAPQFLLDNMLHDGTAGYHVLTALRVPGLRELLLVNRGWVDVGPDRGRLPPVGVASGLRDLTGRLERLPRPGLRLAAPPTADRARGVVVLQYPTADELARLLDEPVLDYQLLLDAVEPDGFVRVWHAPGVAPERHLAYAGQWLALALLAGAAGFVMAYRHLRRTP